jgi:predicted small integral membrane protein
MSMDTIFPNSTIGYRAITTPALHHAGYAMIIAAELVTAILCWIGAARLLGALRAIGAGFNGAKGFAVAGLLMGLLTWQVGFITIGGEWFGMWMSQTWNGVPSAFRLVVIILGTLIFVALPTAICRQKPANGGRQTSTFSAAMNASCGISTLPYWRIFFLPFFCLSRSLRLRVTSPP